MNQRHKFFLLFLDLIVLLATLVVVSYYRISTGFQNVLMAPGLWAIILIAIAFLYIFGAYDISHSNSPKRMLARSALAMILTVGAVILINYIGAKERSGIFGRGILGGSLALFWLISSLYRWVIVSMAGRSMQKARWLFVCTRAVLESFREDLRKNPFIGQIFFLVDDKKLLDSVDVIGDWTSLDETLKSSWTSVIVAIGEDSPKEVVEKLMVARFENTKVRDVIQFYEETWKKVPLYYLGSHWFLLTEGFDLLGNPIRLRMKRLMDIGLSGFLLVIASPLMALTWLVVRLESSGPAIYTQVRTGKDGRPFVIFKFRSMRIDAEKSGAQWATINDDRITRVGRIIRKTRLDELPQLINILSGSMSFIGPRPERPEFNVSLSQQIPFYNLRHMIHPGLTGWAQVLYPYGASVEDAKEKLQYDLYYIKNYSLWMDISILLQTAQVVLFGRGR